METANGHVVADKAAKPQLTREEVLQVENHVLKIENFRLQTERLQSDLTTASALLHKERMQLRIYCDALREKYGEAFNPPQLNGGL